MARPKKDHPQLHPVLFVDTSPGAEDKDAEFLIWCSLTSNSKTEVDGISCYRYAIDTSSKTHPAYLENNQGVVVDSDKRILNFHKKYGDFNL